jgi:hypothetical protein
MPSKVTPRYFPRPWTVEEKSGLFIVRDVTGQALGYFYFVDEQEQRPGFEHLTRDEAQQIAIAVSNLPELALKS